MYLQDTWRIARRHAGLRVALRSVSGDHRQEQHAHELRSDPLRRGERADARTPPARRSWPEPGTLERAPVAGQNSPLGEAIYETDKNNFQPRVGASWDGWDGQDDRAGGYGIYYDQPLVGIFVQNAFINPPYVNKSRWPNASLSTPVRAAPTAVRCESLRHREPFEPREPSSGTSASSGSCITAASIDIGYVGSRGDNLIQPVEINQPQPADVVRIGNVNLARPYRGFAGINCARPPRKRATRGCWSPSAMTGRAGSLHRPTPSAGEDARRTTATRRPAAEPAGPGGGVRAARTDRTHAFTAN